MSGKPPVKNNGNPTICELVIADMRVHDRIGRDRYGTPLKTNNWRDALIDAYHESMDLTVYLRQAIEEEAMASHAVQKLGVKLLDALDLCQKEIRLQADFPEAKQDWQVRAVAYRDVKKWIEELFPHAFVK